MQIVSALIMFLLCFMTGCALQRDTAGPVNDPNFEWVRVGFSVKAPSGSNWYRMPARDGNLNAIEFQKSEGIAIAEFSPRNTIYIKGSNAFAASTIFDKPVKDRYDKKQLAMVLRKHLERRLLPMKERLEESVYDTSLGADCLKYSATSTLERIHTDYGDMHIGAINGYFCLHSNLDNFGVIMQLSTFATVWTEISQKENQSTFFKSLRFLPISSTLSRNFTKR